jgi:hypothetical protein
MFRITAETCRAFTLAEILILAAMNVESYSQQTLLAARGKVDAHCIRRADGG